MARIGVAISGGGYRATTWGLGALLYLVDAGRNTDVTSISSVSGGSVANGVVAHETQFRATDPAAMRAAVRPLLRHMAHDGLFFFGASTNAYVGTVLVGAGLAGLAALSLVAAIVAAALDALGVTGIGWASAWVGWSVVALAVIAVLTFLLARARSRVVERALRRTFFSRDGGATALGDLPKAASGAAVPLHVFCSTELQRGQQFYATPEFVYTWAYGMGRTDPMTVARAVQCSACLPGGFAPRFLPTAPFGFTKPDVPKHVVLSDGGVYDNMADQWETGRSGRPIDEDLHPAADELIVVNSSAAATTVARRARGLRAELFGLTRPIDVMYDVTTKLRRFELVEEWNRAAREGGRQGTLVHIPQSPITVCERLAELGTPEQQARAVALRPLIPGTPEEWTTRAARSTGVRTTLGRLGAEPVAELLYHSYVLTMVNTHVILGYPLVAFPTIDDMRVLVARG